MIGASVVTFAQNFPSENNPLQSSPNPSYQSVTSETKGHVAANGLFYVFYGLCCLTGQLTVRPKSGERLYSCKSCIFVTSTLFLLVFGIVNLASFVFDIYAIAWCPFEHCGCIYTDTNDADATNQTLLYNMTNFTVMITSAGVKSRIQCEDWQKVVITTATISGLLSYYLMVILVLCPLYGVCNPCSKNVCECVASIWRNCGEREARSSATRESSLNPFVDSNDYEISTSLGPRQSFYFHLIFWANLILFTANVVVFFIILKDDIGSKDILMKVLDIVGLAAQFGSQFCAILSCFIFSKVAYAISRKCLEMKKVFSWVNRRAGINSISWNLFLDCLVNSNEHYLTDDDRAEIAESGTPHLTTLKKLDDWYVKKVKSSIDPYGTWFAVHWVLYTLTAFMSITYFAEAVIEKLNGYDHKSCFSPHNTICTLDLVYISLFMLEHCVLFLYPCFRAASVSAARSTLIKNVSRAEWNHIPLLEKESFCAYLNNQKCEFTISILCAKISFGFSMAYISIFLGVFGVILKISF